MSDAMAWIITVVLFVSVGIYWWRGLKHGTIFRGDYEGGDEDEPENHKGGQ